MAARFGLGGIALRVFGAGAAVAFGVGEASAQTVNYGYDALGRLITVNRSDGTSATYAYDPAGNRSQVVMATPPVTPGAFELGDPVIAASGAWAISAAPKVTGITSPVAVSIVGGQYRIDGGTWTTTNGTVSAGQTVQIQVQAPGVAGTSQTATLTVGGVSDTFQVTAAADTTPDAYELGNPVSAASGAWAESSMVTVAGVNAATPVSIVGGQYRINGGAWTTANGTVSAGQTVQIQVQAPGVAGTSQTATLTVGGVSDTFQVTAAADTTPDAYELGNPVSAASGAWAESSMVTVAGVNAATPVSIVGGQYRINGGAWTTANGTVSAGQTVQVRVQAPGVAGASQTATLTVGGLSDTFQVTAAADTTPDPIALVDQNRVADEDASYTAGSIFTITGINQPISLQFSRDSLTQTGNASTRRTIIGRSTNGGASFAEYELGAAVPPVVLAANNGDQFFIKGYLTTTSGRATARWRNVVTNLTTGQSLGAAWIDMAVDNDDNHNVADYTLDPVNWSNLSETSSSTDFVTGGAGLPLAGINRNITLRATITGLSGNLSAGSRLEMWVNGAFRYHSTNLGNGSWAGGDFAPGENVQFVARAVSADGAQRSGGYTVTVQNITTGQTVDTFSVAQSAAVPDFTPDAFNDFIDQNAVTNDPTIWFGPGQSITGINRPITLRVERYNYSGNFDMIAVNVYRDSGAGWVLQGSFDPRTSAGYQYVDFTVNNGDKIHYAVDARTTEGRKTGSMNMVVWNLSQPGGSVQLSSRNVNMTVDNDNNYNISDYTLDSFSMPTLSVVSNENSAWTNTGVIAVAGINRTVTLRFTRSNQWDSFAPGSTGTRRLFVYHSTNNGASWNEHIIGAGTGAVLDVTVNNGDLLHARTWFDTTTGRGESSFTGYITNLQTGAQLSSFNVSGVVDADNNYNIGGNVTATDWPGVHAAWNSTNGSSPRPNYTTGPARTISGLASGQTATLSLSAVVNGDSTAWLIVNLIKNGVDQGQKLSSPAYSTNVDANYPAVTVQNGDQIAFKVIVNGETADQFNPSVSQGKGMNVTVYASPGGGIDSFGASGSYSDSYGNCGEFELCNE